MPKSSELLRDIHETNMMYLLLLQRLALLQGGLDVRHCLEVLLLHPLQLLLCVARGLQRAVAVQKLLARPHELERLLLALLYELLSALLHLDLLLWAAAETDSEGVPRQIRL